MLCAGLGLCPVDVAERFVREVNLAESVRFPTRRAAPVMPSTWLDRDGSSRVTPFRVLAD